MREIEELFAAWREAGKRGDAAALVSLITEDAEFWTRPGPERSMRLREGR